MTTLAQSVRQVGEPAVRNGRWRTLSAWAGVAFVPVFFVGALLASNSPESNESDAKVVAWYSDDSHRSLALVGAYLLIVSAVLFLTFAAGMLERLRTARAQAPVAYRLATWTAGAFATLVVVGAVEFVGEIGNISFGNSPVPSADVLRANNGFPILFVGGALVVAVHIVTVALLARHLKLFPTWLVVLSCVFAVVLLGALIFTPMAALPLWVLIVAIRQLSPRERVEA